MSEVDSIAMAVRGKEITGLDIYQTSAESITAVRVEELVSEMNADQPTGGTDMAYGKKDTQHLRFWKTTSSKAPIIIFVHGGSWRSGTNLDLIGSAKVDHLISKGYAFATVNYTLIPSITVEEQVQEVADSVGYLVKNAARLDFDPDRVILMGHSSGAHVVTLLGTDPSYVERAGISLDIIRGVISLDGSNYNALAEITDSPGPVADNTIYGLGSDPERLHAMSPTYHAHAPNAGAFLLLHVHRQGGVRQAVELVAALKAAGTDAVLRVFEGQGFEGHVQMLLRLGDPAYPATLVMDEWLRTHVPVD
ncbi:Alpha/Beta hydrolase protein [Aspergillus caelatus]|uniref:Alpha/Beta hydrolase protein n=1 Tax=Aspergillus caelatus TaxID=61420 RepID=A0A5N6ZT55_9EURO|nr:Alpha/Beta hydrolase protein [Aspergillus caelatus]KAE8359440.1 Alpha/Beta hydrolase protein [Aspergillus caelatus]